MGLLRGINYRKVLANIFLKKDVELNIQKASLIQDSPTPLAKSGTNPVFVKQLSSTNG